MHLPAIDNESLWSIAKVVGGSVFFFLQAWNLRKATATAAKVETTAAKVETAVETIDKTAIKIDQVKEVVDGPLLASLKLNVLKAKRIFNGSPTADDLKALQDAQSKLDAHEEVLVRSKEASQKDAK